MVSYMLIKMTMEMVHRTLERKKKSFNWYKEVILTNGGSLVD